MEVNDNYSEIVSLCASLLDSFAFMMKGSAVAQTPVLTYRECLLILDSSAGTDPFAEMSSENLDLEALTKKVAKEFGTNCFVIDKLPRGGDAMPDPYNANVCNQFQGICAGKLVIEGQQSVHDATRIHQRSAIHMHNGSMPHGVFSINITDFASTLQG